MAVTGTVSLSVTGVQTPTTALDMASGSGVSDVRAWALQVSLIAGASGALAVDRMAFDQRNLVASATEDLDLVGGSQLTDFTGTAVSFAKIKLLAVKALSTNTNNVVVGNATSNAWAALLNSTGTLTLRPGTGFVVCATDATGYATTAGTGDLLKIANSAGTTGVDYQIAILGTVA